MDMKLSRHLSDLKLHISSSVRPSNIIYNLPREELELEFTSRPIEHKKMEQMANCADTRYQDRSRNPHTTLDLHNSL